MVIPALCAAVTIAAAVPVIVVTAVAVIATLVSPSTVFRSAAAADASVTVMVRALLELASVNVFNVARSFSATVAVTTPAVTASIAISSATVAVPVFNTVTAASGS